MDLRSLKYFVAVYEAGSLTAASRVLYISQPSISLALEKLENELQTSLFIRRKQGVTPTDDGNRLYPSAKHLLEQAAGIKSFFTSPTHKQRIHVYVERSIRISLIAHLMKALTRELPDLELRITAKPADADIRFTSSQLVAETEQFEALWEDRFLAILPRDSILQVRQRIELKELLEYPLIERANCEFHEQMMTLITQSGYKVSLAAKVDSEEWAVALAAAGIGVAIVPASSIWGNETVAFCEIDGPAVSRTVGIACSGNSHHRSRIKPITLICRNHLVPLKKLPY